jgi:hypothetical protein
MAKKSAKNHTPPLFEDLREDGPSTVRPLPPTVQALFLSKLLVEAAHNNQIEAYAERRTRAHGLFRDWVKNLRSGQLFKLSETQLEQDFTTSLLESLGYQTHGQVLPGQPWSMQPKWSFHNVGIADVALGRFAFDSGENLTAQIAVVVELKGARVDLDRRDPGTKRSPVQQAWDYLSACDTARWALVTNFVEFRLYSREKTRNHVHRVLLDDLDDPEAFARFFAVFHADSLLGEGRLTLNAQELLKRTDEKQKSVGDDLYRLYDESRFRLIQILQAEKGVADLDTAIRTAQKLLDRVLFVAFAEDRRLIDSRNILETTCQMQVPMLSAWDNFRNLFRAFDKGHPRSGISEFDGGLFETDPILDDPAFELGDEWPQLFETIGKYDFRDEVTVEVLGHLFERSITDLEKLRERGADAYQAEAAEAAQHGKKKGRRRREGVFYTNRSVVDYLVAAALNPTWNEHRAALAAKFGVDLDQAEPFPPPFLRALLARLDDLTVCDPACGSGAFLIAAYDWFEEHRMALLADLAEAEPDAPECAGGHGACVARTTAQILGHNLYGVDLAAEAVEIARLSLWIRTARKDQKLTQLSHNIVEGNSVVDDPAVDPRAFDWHARFLEVFARGGFDAVVGNPPYVRQEWLGAIKPHLAERFQTYHGMADLYVYFYERGLQILKPGGRLAFVVTNKWMKAGYGEPLRRFFAEQAWVEQVVDFGHAKQFFPDADVFPCFLVARKPDDARKPDAARVCVLPRDKVRLDQLPAQVAYHGIAVEQERFGSDAWNLEPKAVGALLAKIREKGTPLCEYAGATPYRGILTGFNQAFLIGDDTKRSIIAHDPHSSALIKPYLRGQDIERWHPAWAGLWMIALKSSGDHPWPWADLGEDAEKCFQATYPGLHAHLKPFEPQLKARQDHGRYWWELRACAYWDDFDRPKIIFPEMTWRLQWCWDDQKSLINNTAYILASEDKWILCAMNSPVNWWFSWRAAVHGKDEVLRFIKEYVHTISIPDPGEETRGLSDDCVSHLINIMNTQQSNRAGLLDWLRVDRGIDNPSLRLQDPFTLDSDAFVSEVQKSRGKSQPLTAAGLKLLRDEYTRTIEPARARAAEAVALECRLSDLVNAAYGLTPDEVRLMWDTAPPRMPIPRPADLPSPL